MVTGVVPHVGGPILPPCCPTVLIGFRPAARVCDMATCVGPPDLIVTGSCTVLIGGMPAARMLDQTAHGGVVMAPCCPTVLIGDVGSGSAGGAPGAPLMALAVSQASPPPAGPLQPDAASAESSPQAGGGPGQAGESTTRQNSAAQREREKTWIGVQLFDFQDTPIPNESFRIVLRGGQTLSGTTDQNGYARFGGVDPDSGSVHFLDVPEDEQLAGRQGPEEAAGVAPVTDEGAAVEPEVEEDMVSLEPPEHPPIEEEEDEPPGVDE